MIHISNDICGFAISVLQELESTRRFRDFFIVESVNIFEITVE